MLLSRRAWAFMIRSMLALQPYSPVTSTHGESTIRSDTMTWKQSKKGSDAQDWVAHEKTRGLRQGRTEWHAHME